MAAEIHVIEPVQDGLQYIFTEMKTPQEVRECFQVLHVLRSHIGSADDFVEKVLRLQARHGYSLYTANTTAGRVIGAVGCRPMENLMHGRHVYIDDLVVLAEHRDAGIGAQLLHFVIRQASERHYRKVLLDTAVGNEAAARFYLRHGFGSTAHRFTMSLE